MSDTILLTKIYVPPPRSNLVLRSRLVEQLNRGLSSGHKLTLISAPAGFGKTTLVSEWVDNLKSSLLQPAYDKSVAWLSLDEADNDLSRFLTYLISALQTISANIGSGLLSVIQSPQQPAGESLLTELLNEIITIHNGFILVLDDYHLIDSKPVNEALTFLLEHQPTPMHLVITTREDPPLPLARMRARNQLTELRVADLRFTPTEATEFLNKVMGLNLSVENISTLETRTEGWIAGLQLAALSMQGNQDVSAFIQAFAGDHSYIVDYLVEEVLKRQPESIRSFLLQTAILDRLNGPLCDAVTGQPGAKARLEKLLRGNFFLIPLDDKHHWYRYHHLFADVLYMHLLAELPDQVPTLHRNASEWYEQNGSAPDAICHSFAAEDYERAADLVELAAPALRKGRQESTLLGCLNALPEGVFRARPVLSVEYAGALLRSGKIDGVETRLRNAEQWLDISVDGRERPKDMVVKNEEDFQRLPASVAMSYAAIALARGDVAKTVKYTREVLALSREDDYFMRGAACSLLGLASWTTGDLETADQMYSDGMANFLRIGYISDVIGGSITLADIRISQGKLRDAIRCFERGLQLATQQGAQALRGAADMYVGLSGIYYERNEIRMAEQCLMNSKELGELNGLPKNPYRWRVAKARIHESQGNLKEALDALDEAELLYVGDFSPNIHPIPALKARIWVKQGELGKALDWARARKLSIEEVPCYLREFELITFARILLSQFQGEDSTTLLHDTMLLLTHLLRGAEEGGRIGSVIEILILKALAYQRQLNMPEALQSLERALKLAEPEGYMRIILTEGSSMGELIREAVARGILPNYTRTLLSAFEAENSHLEEKTSLSTSLTSSPLIDSLSQRELDIIRLFKTEMSGPEIAQELVIALSTVRTHTKSIYRKLNVNNRRAAINRAAELNLI